MIASFGRRLVGRNIKPCIQTRHKSRFNTQKPLVSLLLALQSTTVADSSVSEAEIENLDRQYCDDFVCNSSPAVEATIRSLARDIERANGVWTRNLFAATVVYKDPYRSFKGREPYARQDFIPHSIQSPTVKVTRMEMIDGSTAKISWILTGNLGPLPVVVNGFSKLLLNLLTGQIERHEDSWETSGLGAVAWNVSRLIWSAKMSSVDAANASKNLIQSLSSGDEEDGSYTTMRDPTDPTKFFQHKDPFYNDAIFYMGVLAVLYVFVRGLTLLG